MARILLAEPNAITREGLRQIVATDRDLLVAAYASSVQEALQEVSRSHFDVLLLDTSLPGKNWLDTLKDLRSQRPSLPVLILSLAPEKDEAVRALRAGASGYLSTSGPPDELSTALKRVLSGGKYVSASIAEQLASDRVNGNGTPLHELLSDREYQVMLSLASGKTVSEIANEMSLSVKTVSTYRSRLLEKLNLKNNVDLAHYYTRHVDTRTVRCKDCGQENPRIARFCNQCGASLEAALENLPDISAPPASRKEMGTGRPKLRAMSRSFAVGLSLVVIAAVTAAIAWQTQVAGKSIELKHDDGTSEAETHSDFGGYLVHFTPQSIPFVINKIRIYGAAMPSEKTEFEVQIWDAKQNVIYTVGCPLTEFPTISAMPAARMDSRWVDIPVPNVEVKSDFLVHVFAASGVDRGLVIGVDNSAWNLHSSLTSLTSSGTYEVREGWGKYSPEVFWSDKNNVNWMIRVAGRNGGSPTPATPTASGIPSVPTQTGGSATQVSALPPMGAFMKGFTFADWKPFDAPPPQWGLYRSPEADRSLEELAATGTNWISLLVNVGQETIASTTVSRTQPRTATDEELVRIIDLAHDLGIRVLLLPSLALSNDQGHSNSQIGTAFTSEVEWQEWFASYRELINHYAELSQESRVDALSIGDCLSSTAHRQEDWRRIIAEVRQRFEGPITYSSGGESLSIGWWDAVDYIGLSAFYPLSNIDDPTLAELKAAWSDRGWLAQMESLSREFDRPVTIMRIGYESKDGANRWPATSFTMQLSVDLQEQADCYKAALDALSGKTWLKGIFWWQWWVGQVGGPNDTSYTPHGKPAEDVLKKSYLEGP